MCAVRQEDRWDSPASLSPESQETGPEEVSGNEVRTACGPVSLEKAVPPSATVGAAPAAPGLGPVTSSGRMVLRHGRSLLCDSSRAEETAGKTLVTAGQRAVWPPLNNRPSSFPLWPSVFVRDRDV